MAAIDELGEVKSCKCSSSFCPGAIMVITRLQALLPARFNLNVKTSGASSVHLYSRFVQYLASIIHKKKLAVKDLSYTYLHIIISHHLYTMVLQYDQS